MFCLPNFGWASNRSCSRRLQHCWVLLHSSCQRWPRSCRDTEVLLLMGLCLWMSMIASQRCRTCRRDSLCVSPWCQHHRWSASESSCRWRGGCAPMQNVSHSYSQRWSRPAAGCPVKQVQWFSLSRSQLTYYYGLRFTSLSSWMVTCFAWCVKKDLYVSIPAVADISYHVIESVYFLHSTVRRSVLGN